MSANDKIHFLMNKTPAELDRRTYFIHMTRKKPFIPMPIVVLFLLSFFLGGYLGFALLVKSDRKAALCPTGLPQQEALQADRSVPAAKQGAAQAQAPAAPLEQRAKKPISVPASDKITVHSRIKRLSGMVWIPGGKFMMGSPKGVGESNEHPQHQVSIKGFFMDTTEVTQAEYTRVMSANPSYFQTCPDCPVDSVSWNNAHDYCKKVGKHLPTEAQWEYAARAGSASKYFWGDTMNNDYAWHYSNSENKTHPVAQKKPNAFGLYDMVGNVWEWCADWYASDYYNKKVSNNPRGPDSGQTHSTRGGGFGYNREGYILRCAYRNTYVPEFRNVNIGFRCVR
jgi:formylglycine-generating enzyme required for sulfatase activity